MRYLKNLLDFRRTPQHERLPGRPDQARNSAGGFVWEADRWTCLGRFLVLGSEHGTYYIGERELSLANAATVADCLRADGPRVVNTVVEISAAGRAPKNDPALFVLAMASSPKLADAKTNAVALAALPLVARTGTHLETFAGYARGMRGWGRGLRTAVGRWYTDKSVKELAYQMAKYQSRNGWAQADLLALAHPTPESDAQNALFRWAVTGELPSPAAPELARIQGLELARKAADESEIVRLIEDYRLTHEMIPPRWKNSAAVWEALLDDMPYTAMVRHLGKLTAVGLVAPGTHAGALVVARLADRARIRRSRVHPIALLQALLTYKQGRGVKGSLKWAPVASVTDALDRAFYMAFDNAEPTGRRIYLAIDASGSMQAGRVAGMPQITPAAGAAAMAMLIARSEPNHVIAAFHERVWHVDISKADRLDRAVEAIARESRATDASLPFRDALERKLGVDAFVLITDSETWAGDRHPVQALAEYRRQTGIPARLVVMAMAANGYSIADPSDAFQLDVVGFDASVPGVVAGFIGDGGGPQPPPEESAA